MRQRNTILAAMLVVVSALVISSIASNRRASSDKSNLKNTTAAQESHTITVTPWGPDQAVIDATKSRLLKNPTLLAYLKGKRYRMLSFDFVESAVKEAAPSPPSRYRATFFDYTSNRAIIAGGSFYEPAVEVSLSTIQPTPSPEEFDAAVEIVKQDPKFGPAIRDGLLQPYPPMPPLADIQLPTNKVERTVTVGLLPKDTQNSSEIVGVNMIRGSIIRYDNGAPLTSNAVAVNCGVSNAVQSTSGSGSAGQLQVTISRGTDVVWEFLVIRPSASSGNNRSGIELQNVKYRGKLVMSRGNMPVLNVQYYRNACGPFRDWLWQEGMFTANGTDVAGTNGSIRMCTDEPKTVIDNGIDMGNFRGVAIWDNREQVVLVSELQAGWYRYISKWIFHDGGIISPRFGFGAVSNGCVCLAHIHHAYWRFDFDVITAANNSASEFYQGTLKPIDNEVMRPRLTYDQYWLVQNTVTGESVKIRGGEYDGNYDKYGHGDLWFLRSHFPSEIDDSGQGSGSDAHIDPMVNNESLVNQDVVVWYGAHWIHERFDTPPENLGSQLVGPDLILQRY